MSRYTVSTPTVTWWKFENLKELIPEFFYLPEMFLNENNFKFGKREDRVTVVDDVILPPWADSPEHFVTVHRQVHCNLFIFVPFIQVINYFVSVDVICVSCEIYCIYNCMYNMFVVLRVTVGTL